MSERYEGVVVTGDPERVRQMFGALASPLTLRLVRLADGVSGVWRVAGRADVFDVPAIRDVAARLSTDLSTPALAVFYDNGAGTREAVLYERGQPARVFDKNDERWVPLDDEGEPLLDGPRFRPDELGGDEEYDCVRSALHAGLDALGIAGVVGPDTLKAAFCYDALGWEAERPSDVRAAF